jgi:hypothetical protein
VTYSLAEIALSVTRCGARMSRADQRRTGHHFVQANQRLWRWIDEDVRLTPVTESFLFDPRRYAKYTVESSGAPVDTVTFTPSPRTQALYGLLRVNTPQYSFFSGRFTSFLGREVDFFETAPAHRTDVTADVDFRPSDQLRLTTSYLYSRITRWRDNSLLSSASVPRLKVEYQLSRPLFLRFVGHTTAGSATRCATLAPTIRYSSTPSRPSGHARFPCRLAGVVPAEPRRGGVCGVRRELTEQEAFRFKNLERVRTGSPR